MNWQLVAALSGSSSVALGAIGAHRVSYKSEKEKADWKTACQYHMIHSVVLATLPAYQSSRARTLSGALFTGGIILFSGSLYAYILTDTPKVTGAAPIGGIALIAGWLSLVLLKR